jgi:hypothetical protein
VDVDVTHAGEDQAIIPKNMIGSSQVCTHGSDAAILNEDLSRTHRVDVRQPPFHKDQALSGSGWHNPNLPGDFFHLLSWNLGAPGGILGKN